MTGNAFLDGLDVEDRDAVMDMLTEVSVAAGDILIEQGEPVGIAHFPTTANLANITHTPGGRQLQTAAVGSEGLSGLAPLMADVPCAWEVNCVAAGRALAGQADSLRRLSEERPGLRHRLLKLTHFYQAQANQLTVCTAFHSVEARVARWILTVTDRTGQRRLFTTQEAIAEDLGVQRTSIVAGFGSLKRAGLVRHLRGHLEVRDRAGSAQLWLLRPDAGAGAGTRVRPGPEGTNVPSGLRPGRNESGAGRSC